MPAAASKAGARCAARLTTDTGIYGTGLANDVTPRIDCGAGTDWFHAFGRTRGCESRL
jgi:hypothetical protein